MTLRPRRILIADDDPAICRLIESILRTGPYTTVSTHDAESATEAIGREERFDLIICDYMLPGINGIDFAERVRTDERTQGVPIIMISGHTRYAIDGLAKIAGVNIFLDKPFSIAQLRAAVSNLLELPPTLVNA